MLNVGFLDTSIMSESKLTSSTDLEAQLLDLERRQIDLLERLETATARLNARLADAGTGAGPSPWQDGEGGFAQIEARLLKLEDLTHRLARQTAITHGRVEEVLASKTWRWLSRAGGFLLRFRSGGARR